jgi:hypothetical protein
MPELIIDLLEVVDIQEQAAQAPLIPIAAFELQLDLCLEVMPITESRGSPCWLAEATLEVCAYPQLLSLLCQSLLDRCLQPHADWFHEIVLAPLCRAFTAGLDLWKRL